MPNIIVIYQPGMGEIKILVKNIQNTFKTYSIQTHKLTDDVLNEESLLILKQGNSFVVIIDMDKQCCRSFFSFHAARYAKNENDKNKTFLVVKEEPIKEFVDDFVIVDSALSFEKIIPIIKEKLTKDF